MDRRHRRGRGRRGGRGGRHGAGQGRGRLGDGVAPQAAPVAGAGHGAVLQAAAVAGAGHGEVLQVAPIAGAGHGAVLQAAAVAGAGHGAVFQAAAVAGAGHGEVLQVAPVAGAGHGAVLQAAAVAGAGLGLGVVHQGMEAGREGRNQRVLTEKEVREQLMGVNWNHIPGPSGEKIERKGIYLELDPVEFQEIVLKREYHSRMEPVNVANKELVALYNNIREQRLKSFWCIRKTGPTDVLISRLRKDYNLQMEKAKKLRQRIRDLNGVPVPPPEYFSDREKIFG